MINSILLVQLALRSEKREQGLEARKVLLGLDASAGRLALIGSFGVVFPLYIYLVTIWHEKQKKEVL